MSREADNQIREALQEIRALGTMIDAATSARGNHSMTAERLQLAQIKMLGAIALILQEKLGV